jgi:triosephosphate isomerase
MSRTPLLAGNWKMHGTREEAAALARGLVTKVGAVTGREVLVAPPFTVLDVVADAIAGSRILLAAQNVHWESKGAFTGELSVAMLKEARCTHVIVGHSERRQYFGETDETTARRAVAALEHGLNVIACVGELEAEREADETEAVLRRQVDAIEAAVQALLREREVSPTELGLVIAYEPVWAIGTGKTATPEIAQEAHAFIKMLIDVPVLYGGSVKPENARELAAQPDVDGALVGGASLDLESFAAICRAASRS